MSVGQVEQVRLSQKIVWHAEHLESFRFSFGGFPSHRSHVTHYTLHNAHSSEATDLPTPAVLSGNLRF